MSLEIEVNLHDEVEDSPAQDRVGSYGTPTPATCVVMRRIRSFRVYRGASMSTVLSRGQRPKLHEVVTLRHDVSRPSTLKNSFLHSDLQPTCERYRRGLLDADASIRW
nr:hypothetical protein CFP56_60203 [Quercus suber]